MPNRRLVWRVEEDGYDEEIEGRIHQFVMAGRCKDDISRWLAKEARQCRMSYPLRVILKRLIVITRQAFDYQKALLSELKVIARESGTSMEHKEGVNDGDYTWTVKQNGILHTMDGKPVGSNHSRTITFRLASGPPPDVYWELDILDKTAREQYIDFWAHFKLNWRAYEDGMDLEHRKHENHWHLPDDPSRFHTINDGTSYQGESTRYFDDLLRLVRKLPRMMTYERACQ